ncbi:MAG: hypothetical protein AAFV25_19710 [Bacteroidota bacterium]
MKYLIKYLSRIEPELSERLTGDCARLYELIKSENVRTENDAIQLMYDGPRQNREFSELRIELIRQLTHLIIQNPWHYRTSLQESAVECWKALATVKILIFRHQRIGAVDIALYTLKKARKYDLHRVSVEFAIHLHHHFYTIENNERRGKYYEKILREEKEKAYVEEEVRRKSAKLFYEHNMSRSHTEAFQRDLTAKIKEFSGHYKYESVSINTYIWRLEILSSYLNHEYGNVVAVCHSAINLMTERGIDRTTSFRYKLAPAQLLLRQYDDARENIRLAISRIKQGEYSWSVFTYYRLLIELHAGEYEQAYLLYLAASKVPQMSRALDEQWRIVKAYIAFLIRSGHIRKETSGTPHFRKIIGEMPIFSQDKQGNNINIIILQLLLNLGHNNDVLIDRAEAIRKYMQRHMKSRQLIRARTFIEMLLMIPRYRFHYQAVLRHSALKRKKLESRPLQMTQNQDIEIIPYTELWKMTLSVLQKYHEGRRSRTYRR